jgi:hypothetical protein
VPHFYDAKGTTDVDQANINRDKFLKDVGLQMIAMPFSGEGLDQMLKATASIFKDIVVILSGESANKCNHSVLVRNGEIVCDTSRNDAGIVGPCDDGYYWVELLLPYDVDAYLAEAGIRL